MLLEEEEVLEAFTSAGAQQRSFPLALSLGRHVFGCPLVTLAEGLAFPRKKTASKGSI